MSIYYQLCAKTSQRICMKFSGKVGNGPMNKWLNFDGDPDPYPYRDRPTGKTCLGGGMHCPSASGLCLSCVVRCRFNRKLAVPETSRSRIISSRWYIK